MAKLLEKLIINRINQHLFSKNLLSKSQFGFRPNVSTEDAVQYVDTLGRNALLKGEYLLIIVLDISGAFDNCWFPQILKQLKDKNCPKNLYKIIQSYLTDRKAVIKVGQTIVSKNLTKGCPQGSALGPGLWNIGYDELLNLNTPDNCEIKGYCDDTKILVYGNNLQTIESNANQILKQVYDWGRKVKLEFNASKTTALIISNKRNLNINIQMNGFGIEVKDNNKYLGVFIDRKLNYNKHIEYLKQKTTSKIMKLPLIARNTWGLSYESLKVIYRAAFEPSILYCSSVWAKNLTKSNIKKLKSIQRLFAIKMIRGYRTVSYESAVTIAGLTPIDIKICEKNNIFQIKHQKYGSICGLNCQLMERNIEFSKRSHPALSPNIIVIKGDHNSYDYDFEVFTDGSKLETNVGSSFVVYKENSVYLTGISRIGTLCSVFQSELIAIRSAIQSIINLNTNSTNTIKVLFLTDSQSAISAIKQFNNSHPLVIDIKNLIKSCDNSIVFHFKWIKGHSGIDGNERADQMAKLAANLDQSLSVYNLYPLSFAKNHFKTETIKEWQQFWSSTTKGSQTKQFFPDIRDRLRMKSFKPNFIISQYLSGHGNFGSYLKRFKLRSSDVCDCGEDIETPIHIIFYCQKYRQQRHQLINSIHRTGHSSLTLRSLLRDENIYREFIIFLKSIHS